ncbi:MAG TPA: SGNH/GDSL hydrolase family protein [Stellaceae bacterium]|nr:SGNH/GDSL hydrolase family protein [Stellaceae bacterium]
MAGALAGLVILVLGDSHMAGPTYLISSLHDALQGQGAQVHTYGMCGASPNAWLYKTTVSCGRAERHTTSPTRFASGKQEYTWQINDLLAQIHPNLVIVEAADAIGGYGDPQLPKGWIYDQVHALTTKIAAANAACVWVGPVYGDANSTYHKADDRVRALSEFLSKSVAPCAYVDSLKFVSNPRQWPTTDGQHLTPPGYRAWGADIAKAVVNLKAQNQLR